MNKYITKNGLKVLYVYKPDYVKSYCGIGTNYGGGNVEFELDGKKITSPAGIAHFIEHKLFAMPDGSDAFNTFNQFNAVSNAYTASDKTLYFFTTTDSIYEPLKLLLDMYFTPYFKEEDIEHEKEIIISELKMYDDKPEARFQKKLLEALYPNDNYSLPVGGTIDSVSNTNVDDLITAYNAFYTPKNSYLVIVSNHEKEEVFKFIEDCLSNIKSNNNNIEKLPTVSSSNVGKNFTHLDNINQTQAVLGIRFNASTDNELFCNFMIGIFDCLFSPMAKFYNELYKEKVFTSDIDYVVVTEKYSAYATITTTSNHPEEFNKLLEEKLKNITVEDLDKDILDLYLRHLKARSIRMEDSIEALGDEILGLALEGSDYYHEQRMILDLKIEDFYDNLKHFKDAMYLQAIFKKNKKTK